MKFSYTSLLAALALAAVLALCPSCSKYGKNHGQNVEFASYIKGHTGGIISDKTTIKVQLSSDLSGITPGADLKDGILTFSPKVKGTARWLNSSTIEFMPENGELQAGRAYAAKLRLDKLMKVDKNFRRFSFKFLVAIKEAALTFDGITILPSSPDAASAEGMILLTEELPLETVQEMFRFKYPEKGAEANVTAGTDPLSYHYELTNLKRSDKDRTLEVWLDPEGTGFTATGETSWDVPAMGNFKLLGYNRTEGEDAHVLLQFSEPLADSDDMTGLFAVMTDRGPTEDELAAGIAPEGLAVSQEIECQIQTEGSRVLVYYDGGDDRKMTLLVSKNVKSYDGSELGEDYSFALEPAKVKPAVEIPLSGTILPNSKELILPFKAVNLKAVDIKVIKVYEDNMLHFLQDNSLSGSQDLRRSGRLVYKGSIRLDSDPSKNLRKWQDFSVDLSGMFKQEPGAIYRIGLSFKQEYSLYDQNDNFRSGTPQDGLVTLSAEGITEEDDEVWDRPYPYYYEDYYDWDDYKWEDRDNPLKPSYYMLEQRFPQVNLLASNLGIIAKYSGGDKILVAVNDILTAYPVFNAELYVYSYQLKEIGYAKTGTDGMAEISLSGKPFAVVAKRSGATSYLKVSEGEQNSLSRFDVGGKLLDKGLKAYVYGERGVWRPGDTMYLTMILEDKLDKIPDNHPVSLELYTPEGQFYTKLINSEGKNGVYTYAVTTKEDDPTGTWNAYFKVGGATFHKALRVEAIKPNRLKIDLDFAGETPQGGMTMPVTIRSSWLTGPAASGLQAKAVMTLRPASASFKGFEGYTFKNPASGFTYSEFNLIDAKLDAKGQATQLVTMPKAEDAPGMLRADIVSSVEEEGGDVSYTSFSMDYSPFSSYVGIKVPKEGESNFLETDKDYEIGAAVVDKDGKRVAGVNLSYAIYKLKWGWWWESRDEDLDSYVSGTAADALVKGTVKSGLSDAKIKFRVDYPEWGRYLVTVRDENSGHVTGEILYADWPSYRGRSSKSDPNALSMLTFSTDKDSYDVGETATVYIPAAAKGQALVSLENATEVISREWVKTSDKGETAYKFKVTSEMAPNFYVHITLLQPHQRMDNDLPIRLYGVQPVLVNDEETRLNPIIVMADELRPEEEFTVNVKEKNGKTMTYTLAIVDEGLLGINSFKTPDPWNALCAREALGVSTWDLYDEVIGAFGGRFSPMYSIGGDEGSLGRGSNRDNRFNPVVKFLGPFTLQSGTATHKITLPMYVGSVRVMVVAARNGAYGNAEKTVPVKAPLMVLPTLPRTIGTGEKVTLPVNVFALEQGVRKAEVSVKTEGPLRIEGASKATVDFPEIGNKLARFSLEATGTGTAAVTVTATGGGQKASHTINVEVKNPVPATISVIREMIGAGESKDFMFNSFTNSEEEWGKLELSSFPSLNYASITSFLMNYEYECTEQIASQGLGLLAVRDVASESGKELIDAKITELLQALYQRQSGSGGFAYWPGDSDADNWVSSMAGQFMIDASQNGFSVSKGTLASWARYQKKCVQDYRNAENRHLWDLEQAYRLYTLALSGEPESGAMNRLKESKDLSLQASWMLASAYAVSGKKTVSAEIISGLQTNFTEIEEDRTFSSPVRDKAIAMEALVLTDELPDAIDLAQEIVSSMEGRTYVTQEAAFALGAIRKLRETIGDDGINASVITGEEEETIRSGKSTASLNINGQSGKITVANNSESPVYATLVTSAREDGVKASAAKSSGLSLSMGYTADNGASVNPKDVTQGTEFTMAITVRNTSGTRDYRNLALKAMVPSGWELINDRLLRLGGTDNGYRYRDIRDDRVSWFFSLGAGQSKTFKIKVQAAYEGDFILPAVTCEEMYDASISASSASGRAIVSR